MEISVNKEAFKIVQEVMDKKNFFQVEVKKLNNGATVLDFSKAGYPGGAKLGEICMGGYGTVTLGTFTFDNITVPEVTVTAEYPHVSCLGSQYAGWRCNVKDEGYFAMVSGPARALKGGEKGLFEELGYRDTADVAVAVLEANVLPNEKVMEFIAGKCNVPVANTYVCVAPTKCVAGSVQIAARVVETGLHKLHEVGFDPKKVLYGIGTVPIAPLAKNDTRAMGVTNDAIIAAGQVFYNVDSNDEEMAEKIKLVPSSTSRDYGKPFFQIFKDAGKDFFKIDAHLFAPALITMNNVNTGTTLHAGKVDLDLLKKSFGVE
ncbi:MAG: methenyltetrahydromethanopterin cyclohydrolase [Candidatus Helarchaeota archaeon]